MPPYFSAFARSVRTVFIRAICFLVLLMEAVFSDLLLSPARRMFLEVDEQNRAAIRLYEKLGFTVFGQPFDEAGIAHVRMYRP